MDNYDSNWENNGFLKAGKASDWYSPWNHWKGYNSHDNGQSALSWNNASSVCPLWELDLIALTNFRPDIGEKDASSDHELIIVHQQIYAMCD